MDYLQDKTTEAIIKCAMTVHNELGPGFLECIYRKALLIELRCSNLPSATEKEISIRCRGEVVGVHRLDLLVVDAVIVELKTVELLSKAHYAHVRSYLRATRLGVALLIDFARSVWRSVA